MDCLIPFPVDAPANSLGYPELIKAYLEGRKETTRKAYASDLEHFRHSLAAPSVPEVARVLLSGGPGAANQHVLRYRASMTEAGLSSSTVARRLSAVRSLVSLARMLGLVAWTLEVASPTVETYRDTRGPGQAGFASLMLAATTSTNQAKATRDRAILLLLYVLALRRAEVVSLRLEDFSEADGCLWVLGKARNDRERITIPASVLAALKAWLTARGSEPGALFVALGSSCHGHPLTVDGVYSIIKALGASVGLDVHPHGLRHSGITAALDATGGNLRMVQRYSRHKDVRTLQRYDDNRQDLGGMVADLVAAKVG